MRAVHGCAVQRVALVQRQRRLRQQHRRRAVHPVLHAAGHATIRNSGRPFCQRLFQATLDGSSPPFGSMKLQQH